MKHWLIDISCKMDQNALRNGQDMKLLKASSEFLFFKSIWDGSES